MRPSALASLKTSILTFTALFVLPALHAATQTFNYTGAEQQFVVPAGVTSITVAASGAQGGQGGRPSGTAPGSNGGTTNASFPVTPGATLYIYVGGVGGNGAFSLPGGPAPIGGAGGFNGGGKRE